MAVAAEGFCKLDPVLSPDGRALVGAAVMDVEAKVVREAADRAVALGLKVLVLGVNV